MADALKITKTAPEPETVFSGHQTGPVYRPNLVAPQQQAAPVEENGEAVNVPQPSEQQPEQVSAPVEQNAQRIPAAWEDLSPQERADQTAQDSQTVVQDDLLLVDRFYLCLTNLLSKLRQLIADSLNLDREAHFLTPEPL
jgi:type IV secretory pathway VirB10-like protein